MNLTKILRVPEVQGRTGMSKTTIDRLEKAGKFPLRIQITERAIGWAEEEIAQWLNSRQPVENKKTSKRGGE